MSELYKSVTIHEAAQKGVAEEPRPLPEAAKRALAEAAERRAAREAEERARPKEYHGRGGLDPARYEDWEVKGIAIDF